MGSADSLTGLAWAMQLVEPMAKAARLPSSRICETLRLMGAAKDGELAGTRLRRVLHECQMRGVSFTAHGLRQLASTLEHGPLPLPVRLIVALHSVSQSLDCMG
jgi:hypothetical protein